MVGGAVVRGAHQTRGDAATAALLHPALELQVEPGHAASRKTMLDQQELTGAEFLAEWTNQRDHVPAGKE